MSIFTIHMSDKIGSRSQFWRQGTRDAIGACLTGFFDRICTSGQTGFNASACEWTGAGADIPSYELLVYFVPNQDDSIIKQAYGGKIPLTALGTTHLSDGDGNISEVYMDFVAGHYPHSGPITLHVAKVALHELMHNKLKLGKALHSRAGAGIAKAVYRGQDPTERNIALMAGALRNPVKQNAAYL